MKTHSMYLVGQTFGRWSVLGFYKGSTISRRKWVCQCSCEKGVIRPVLQAALCRGTSISCGCHQREKVTKHGMYLSSVYNSWSSMKERCDMKSHPQYHRYGGRGIKICSGLRDFSEFFRLLGDRPRGLSLDKIDNNANYSCGSCAECLKMRWPMNVRWATQRMQCGNRENNIHVTLWGETKVLDRWCKELSLPRRTLTNWHIKGMTYEAAILSWLSKHGLLPSEPSSSDDTPASSHASHQRSE